MLSNRAAKKNHPGHNSPSPEDILKEKKIRRTKDRALE
jgi:hypothetical protein